MNSVKGGMKNPESLEALEIAKKAWEALEKKKGEKILLLDVKELTGITDFYLLASGSSAPHLKAMFSEVQHALKEEGIYCYRKAGKSESGWLVLDYIDVVIHVFSAEARQYYAVEELWGEAPIIPHQ